MADLNDPLKESYISKVGDELVPYTAELTTAGFDPTSRIGQLTGAGKLIKGASKARRAAEEAAATAVKNEQDLRDNYYQLATATVSLVEGLFTDKSHPLTVKLRGLRADLIGNQNPGGTTPTPTPKP